MRKRTIAGLVFICAGLFQCAISGYVVHEIFSMDAMAEAAWQRNDAQCKTALRTVGEVKTAGATVEVRMTDYGDWKQALGRASSVIAYCPTREMTYFCIGSTCEGQLPAPEGEKPGPSSILFRLTGVSR